MSVERGTAAQPRMRLFVAAELPADALAAIAAWQERELAPRQDVRVNRALHLTLCFLGDTPATVIPAIEAALGGVPLRTATVALGEPLFLPERGKKRVVALQMVPARGAPDGLERLRRLQADTTDALAAAGFFAPEKRPWLPHATVARFRRPGQPFPLQNVNFGELCLSRVVLYTSVLDKGGAIHTPLATFTAR
jgi:RNA 2',3'-cyclic 3'-phosphodiesterase